MPDDYGMMGWGCFGGFSLLGLFTWLLLLFFLILGSVYFWQQIKKEK